MATTTTVTQTSPEKLALAFDAKIHEEYKYVDYLPVYDETTKFPALQPFEFHDRGLVANKAKPNSPSVTPNGRLSSRRASHLEPSRSATSRLHFSSLALWLNSPFEASMSTIQDVHRGESDNLLRLSND